MIIFVNTSDPVLKRTNVSLLNDDDSLLYLKAVIPSIIKTLSTIVITKDVYN